MAKALNMETQNTYYDNVGLIFESRELRFKTLSIEHESAL
jgi:hypothetical protein